MIAPNQVVDRYRARRHRRPPRAASHRPGARPAGQQPRPRPRPADADQRVPLAGGVPRGSICTSTTTTCSSCNSAGPSGGGSGPRSPHDQPGEGRHSIAVPRLEELGDPLRRSHGQRRRVPVRSSWLPPRAETTDQASDHLTIGVSGGDLAARVRQGGRRGGGRRPDGRGTAGRAARAGCGATGGRVEIEVVHRGCSRRRCGTGWHARSGVGSRRRACGHDSSRRSVRRPLDVSPGPLLWLTTIAERAVLGLGDRVLDMPIEALACLAAVLGAKGPVRPAEPTKGWTRSRAGWCCAGSSPKGCWSMSASYVPSTRQPGLPNRRTPRVAVRGWMLVEVPGAWGPDAIHAGALGSAPRRISRIGSSGVTPGRYPLAASHDERRARGASLRVRATRPGQRPTPVWRLEVGALVRRDGRRRRAPRRSASGAGVGAARRSALARVHQRSARPVLCQPRTAGRPGAARVAVGARRCGSARTSGVTALRPTSSSLPDSLYFGHVEPDRRQRPGAPLDAGRIELERFRGRTTYSLAEQAVEHFVRAELGVDGIDAVIVNGRRRRRRLPGPRRRSDARVRVARRLVSVTEPLTCAGRPGQLVPEFHLVSIT